MSPNYAGLAVLLALVALAVIIGVLMGSETARHFCGHCVRVAIFGVMDGAEAVKEGVNVAREAVDGLWLEVRWGGKQ